MDANASATLGPRRHLDDDSQMRLIASLRTYLLFVLGTKHQGQGFPDRGLSDIVDSVLVEAFAIVREGGGRLTLRSKNELIAWLVQRMEWRLTDRRRRHETYERILAALPQRPPGRTPSSEAAINEASRKLADARAKLNPADRELIHWREVEQLTFAQIAELRGVSTSYAKRAYDQALARLRRNFLGSDQPPSE
jgi:RNA polymerase sigma factor (sigma-70 family)